MIPIGQCKLLRVWYLPRLRRNSIRLNCTLAFHRAYRDTVEWVLCGQDCEGGWDEKHKNRWHGLSVTYCLYRSTNWRGGGSCSGNVQVLYLKLFLKLTLNVTLNWLRNHSWPKRKSVPSQRVIGETICWATQLWALYAEVSLTSLYLEDFSVCVAQPVHDA